MYAAYTTYANVDLLMAIYVICVSIKNKVKKDIFGCVYCIYTITEEIANLQCVWYIKLKLYI